LASPVSHAVAAVGIAAWFYRPQVPRQLWAWGIVAAVEDHSVVGAASHGILDAMTNGGLGVALLSPLDTTRYFRPWRPIQVSPISLRRFFSDEGVRDNRPSAPATA
jgi:inner membrane protein